MHVKPWTSAELEGAVRGELNHWAPLWRRWEVPEGIRAAEERVLKLVEMAIITHLSAESNQERLERLLNWTPETAFSLGTLHSLTVKGNRCTLCMTPAGEQQLLDVRLTSNLPSETAAPVTVGPFRCSSRGRYRGLRGISPAITSGRMSSACQEAAFILGAGEAWIEAEFIQRLSAAGDAVGSRVFDVTRRCLGDIADKVWLYAIVEEKGIYLADPLQIRRAIMTAAEGAKHLPHSATNLASGFLGRVTDCELNTPYSVRAAELRQTIMGDLNVAQYDPMISDAETIEYGGSAHVTQPIAVSHGGDLKVSALYSPELKGIVHDRLEVAKPEITETLNRNFRLMRKLPSGLLARPNSMERIRPFVQFLGQLGAQLSD